jgi:hypothetical protein
MSIELHFLLITIPLWRKYHEFAFHMLACLHHGFGFRGR